MTDRITTGLRDLDRVIGGGGKPGELWVVSGEPGVGASTLALGIARAAAIKAGRGVCWLSTTEDVAAVHKRALAAQSRTPIESLDSEESSRGVGAESDLDAARLEISRVKPYGLVRAAQVAVEDGRDLVVLNQLLGPPDVETLGHLKRMAGEGPSWMVAVAPDSGMGRQRFWRALADMADVLVWIDREDLLDPDTPRVGEADLLVMRSGRRTSTCTVAHQERFARFVNMTDPW